MTVRGLSMGLRNEPLLGLGVALAKDYCKTVTIDPCIIQSEGLKQWIEIPKPLEIRPLESTLEDGSRFKAKSEAEKGDNCPQPGLGSLRGDPLLRIRIRQSGPRHFKGPLAVLLI